MALLDRLVTPRAEPALLVAMMAYTARCPDCDEIALDQLEPTLSLRVINKPAATDTAGLMKHASLRLPDDLHTALKVLSTKERRSLHGTILHALEDYLERNDADSPPS